MTDSLRVWWKLPELSDRLTMLVIVGSRSAEHSLRSQVGIGSESHCLLGKLYKISEIVDSEAGLKMEKSGGVFREEGECGDDDVELLVTDLDFADDVSLLAEMLELLVPILETIASEAASLGFEVNWQKTKVQALGCREDMPLSIKVQGHDVVVVEEFVDLGSLIHSTTGSTCDISRRSAITRAAMQNLENQI